MFDHLGWSEIIVLAIVGLIIVGPDKLPRVASDAAKMLRQLRTMARNATADLKAELGPEMADIDLASLHPRRLVSDMLMEDDQPRRPAKNYVPLARDETPPYDADAT
jgi:sec-independent protein translocase protein TatB